MSYKGQEKRGWLAPQKDYCIRKLKLYAAWGLHADLEVNMWRAPHGYKSQWDGIAKKWWAVPT